MRLFDTNWADFIERLTVWKQLSPNARKAFVELKSNHGKDVTEFDGHAQALVAANWLVFYDNGRRVRLCKEYLPFVSVLRGMARNKILCSPDESTLRSYFRDNFNPRERNRLISRSNHYYYGYETHLMQRAMSEAWLDELLATENSKQWNRTNRGGLTILDQPRVFEAVRDIVREFKTLREPIALWDLPRQCESLAPALLGSGILACIQNLFLFPTMRLEDMTPVLSLWPTVTHRIFRPKATEPGQVEPDQTFHSALLMDDMTTILVEATACPLRIRMSDHGLFVKAKNKVQANIVSTPAWVTDLNGCSLPARVDTALDNLRRFQFVESAGTPSKSRSIHPTVQGSDWLTESDKGRLKTVLDRLKSDTRGNVTLGGAYSPKLFPNPVQIIKAGDWDQFAETARAFDAIRDNRYVLFEEFLRWQSQENNPLLRLCTPRRPLEVRIGWSTYHLVAYEQIETLWWNCLVEFALTRLLPLGGLRLGIDGTNQHRCISLTDAGRYLLDLADDFDYGTELGAGHPVLIQPNFDVVFTTPSPQVEASIARFAERAGHRVGTLFRITKASILAAATSMTAQQVLDTLRDNSAKQVPVNVEREIQGWFDQCRQVTVRQAILIQCPDRQTAGRVRAAAGKRGTAITDTVIAMDGTKPDAAFFRKLNAIGIFSDETEAPTEKRHNKQPRRRSW